MRSYTVATTAFALSTHPKWIDNLLSHHTVPGVTQSRQGVQRKLTQKAILIISLTKKLIDSLGATTELALSLSIKIAESGEAVIAPGLTIRADLSLVGEALNEQIAQSVEFAPIPRRGRPPIK